MNVLTDGRSELDIYK